jgi:hypothetical protein
VWETEVVIAKNPSQFLRFHNRAKRFTSSVDTRPVRLEKLVTLRAAVGNLSRGKRSLVPEDIAEEINYNLD